MFIYYLYYTLLYKEVINMINEPEQNQEEYVEIEAPQEKKEKARSMFEPTPGMWPHLGI